MRGLWWRELVPALALCIVASCAGGSKPPHGDITGVFDVEGSDTVEALDTAAPSDTTAHADTPDSAPTDASDAAPPLDALEPPDLHDAQDAGPTLDPACLAEAPPGALGAPWPSACEAAAVELLWEPGGVVRALAADAAEGWLAVAAAVAPDGGAEHVVAALWEVGSGALVAGPFALRVDDARPNHDLVLRWTRDAFTLAWGEGPGGLLPDVATETFAAGLTPLEGASDPVAVLDMATAVPSTAVDLKANLLFPTVAAQSAGAQTVYEAQLYKTGPKGAVLDTSFIVQSSALAWLGIRADGDVLVITYAHESTLPAWPLAYFTTNVTTPECTSPFLTGIDVPAGASVLATSLAAADFAVAIRTPFASCPAPAHGHTELFAFHLLDEAIVSTASPVQQLAWLWPAASEGVAGFVGLSDEGDGGFTLHGLGVSLAPPHARAPTRWEAPLLLDPSVRPAVWLGEGGAPWVVQAEPDGRVVRVTRSCWDP